MIKAQPDRRVLQRPGVDHRRAVFVAMASPCEVLVRGVSWAQAEDIANTVAEEAWRIEDKYSRYRTGNIVHRINESNGAPVEVDEETASLLNFANSLHEMSDGRFDITSGALRAAWTFDGSDRVPSKTTIRHALGNVGWHKVRWESSVIQLRPGMQIDFGGIGKEYAVDRAAAAIADSCSERCLVNFGGDLAATGPDRGPAWRVGVERPDSAGELVERVIQISHGGLATSGDSRRYLLKEGVRFGHVLDCTTGWPVREAPRSLTVAADTCTQAGMLATLGILRGAEAEAFLEAQQVQFWCAR